MEMKAKNRERLLKPNNLAHLLTSKPRREIEWHWNYILQCEDTNQFTQGTERK
jgi:hypothetical protein